MFKIHRVEKNYFKIINEDNALCIYRAEHDYCFDFSEILVKQNFTLEDIKLGKVAVDFIIKNENLEYFIFEEYYDSVYNKLIENNGILGQNCLNEAGNIVIESSDGDLFFQESEGDKLPVNKMTMHKDAEGITLSFMQVNTHTGIRIDSVGCGVYESYIDTYNFFEKLEKASTIFKNNIV